MNGTTNADVFTLYFLVCGIYKYEVLPKRKQVLQQVIFLISHVPGVTGTQE